MRMSRTFDLLVLLALVTAAACTQNMPRTQTAPPLPTVPAANMTPSPTLAPQPAAENWDDRTIFRAGLIKAEQNTLDQLPGASVYHLDVQITDDFTSLQGQERVRYTNRAGVPLDALYFQLFPNMSGGKSTVSAVRIDGQERQPVYESDDSTLRVPLAQPLPPGQRLVVQMDFEVELPRERGGNYGLLGYFNNILVLDGFYPAIPVYDEKGWHAGQVPPNADSTFQDASFHVVRVTAPANLTLAASGLQVEQTKAGDHQTITFAAGPARDFYLVASDRFAVVSETVGETRVNSYAFKDRTEGARLALRTAVDALKSYGARLGAYPYTELDVVSTPMQNAYGMEYPGITGLNEALYDLKATMEGLPAPVLLEATTAHEVGHQWFYNVVGNDQINAPWLDESVDQYLTGLYFLDRYGQQGMAGYRDSWLSRWDRVNREIISIGMPAGSYRGKEYGAIVYGRGPLFLEALAQKMGQSDFDLFLRGYYQSHQWGIGTTASFKQLAEKQCQCDLTALFDEWVYPTPALTTVTPKVTPEARVVFYSERDGDAEIYVMNLDGSNQHPLTDNSADDYSPSWSPDGTLIVFESDRDDPRPRTCFPDCNYNLYLMEADGSDVRQLTALPGAEWGATWSPDGKSLLFTAGEIGYKSYGIYRIGLDGGKPQPLLVDNSDNDAADWSPDGKQIAFSSNRDGNQDIFVMNADGSNVHKVVDTGLNDYFPDWSPDGSQIAFFAADWPSVRQDIYTVDADGSNLVNLTNTPQVVDEDPQWSADGTKIIFQSDRDGNFEIYVMNADGSQPQNLTRNPGPDYWPDWFIPPAAKIAFVSDHGGRPQVYLMPAPGTQAQAVVPVSDWQPLTSGGQDHYYPAWSPDGRQIAYYTHLSWQSWAIMLVNADGSNSRQLTTSDGETICSFGPVWSPDGRRIAFTIEPNPRPTCEMKHTEIAVINTDGSGFQILTQNDANDLACSWSRDGAQLIFTSNRDGRDEIYIMNTDGSNPRRLTDTASTNHMPALSPDGRHIAFVSNRDGNDEIYLIEADGANPVRLTNNPAMDWQPSWSPDGQQILFSSKRAGSNNLDIFRMNADGTQVRQVSNGAGWEFEAVWQPGRPTAADSTLPPATVTSVPPTTTSLPATATRVPPTNTPIPETAMPQPTVIPTPEVPRILWDKTYGKTAADMGEDVLVAEDGGFYIVGTAGLDISGRGLLSGDVYLIRTDAAGKVLWDETCGGAKSEEGLSIIRTRDGNLLLAGMTTSSGAGGADAYLIKVDPEGKEIWSKTFGGPPDESASVREMADGGFMLWGNRVDPNDIIADPGAAGYDGHAGRSHVYLTRTDAKGNELWSHAFGDENNLLAMGGVAAPDGGFVVLASLLRFPEPGDDVYLLKVDEDGNQVWTRTWEEGTMSAYDLIRTADDHYLIAASYAPADDTRARKWILCSSKWTSTATRSGPPLLAPPTCWTSPWR